VLGFVGSEFSKELRAILRGIFARPDTIGTILSDAEYMKKLYTQLVFIKSLQEVEMRSLA